MTLNTIFDATVLQAESGSLHGPRLVQLRRSKRIDLRAVRTIIAAEVLGCPLHAPPDVEGEGVGGWEKSCELWLLANIFALPNSPLNPFGAAELFI